VDAPEVEREPHEDQRVAEEVAREDFVGPQAVAGVARALKLEEQA
jgi:hypothetical protein